MTSSGLKKALQLYKLYKHSLDGYNDMGQRLFCYYHENGSYKFNSSKEILNKYKKIIRSLKHAKS